jgi:hypothetical protein
VARTIPLWLKVSYTAYVAVLVPVYWIHYGPANFLWFSDLAFLGLCLALWIESRYLSSMIAVGTIIPELVWNADFFFHLITGRSFFNISNYMFDPAIPLYLRALSGFHFLLPPLELWLLHRLGYAAGAWKTQALVAAVVIPLSRLLSTEDHNVNWAYGPAGRQTWLPDPLYVAAAVVVVVAGFILPAHLLLKRIFRSR